MLNSVHFQLTLRCNLRCPFCGQNHIAGKEAPPEQWLKMASTLPRGISVTLWGGEPLLYPGFGELSRELFRMGFPLSVVTNGTVLEKPSAEVLRECFREIFVSLDGYGVSHDAIRGPGVFEKIKRNLTRLEGHRGKLIFLTTISDQNVGTIADLPYYLAELRPDRIVLQPLIYLSGEEIVRMPDWMDGNALRFWRRDEASGYETFFRTALREVKKRHYPVEVVVTSHRSSGICERPWNSLHISPDGEGRFCTDFDGFSAGNIFRDGWEKVFHSAEAEHFRQNVKEGLFPACTHCPWRSQGETPAVEISGEVIQKQEKS